MRRGLPDNDKIAAVRGRELGAIAVLFHTGREGRDVALLRELAFFDSASAIGASCSALSTMGLDLLEPISRAAQQPTR